mgnify:CR=1 FL=1
MPPGFGKEHKMNPYLHKVQYYETDQMGFVHHANYLRWFEEARLDFLEQIGLPYPMMEEKGYLSPVLSASCRYKQAARFGETVEILAVLLEFGNVRFRYGYEVRDSQSGVLHATGETTHCFIGRDGRVLALRHKDPALFAALRAAVEPTSTGSPDAYS